MTDVLGLEEGRHETGQIKGDDKGNPQKKRLEKLTDVEATLEKNLCAKKTMARELASSGLSGKAIERVLNLKGKSSPRNHTESHGKTRKITISGH